MARLRTTSPWQRLALPASVVVVVLGLSVSGWGLSRLHFVLLEQGTTREQKMKFPERQPVDHPAPVEGEWIAWDAYGFGRVLLGAIILHQGFKLARKRHRPKPPDNNSMIQARMQTHYFRYAMWTLGLLTVVINFLPDVYGVPRGTIHQSVAFKLQSSASSATWEAEQKLKKVEASLANRRVEVADHRRNVANDPDSNDAQQRLREAEENLQRDSSHAVASEQEVWRSQEYHSRMERLVKKSVGTPTSIWIFGPEDLYGYLWDLLRVAWFGSIIAAFIGRVRDMS